VIPSIDYLTLVVAGAILFHYGTLGIEGDDGRYWDGGRFDLLVALIGVFVFVVGLGRALMSAFGV